MAQGKDKNKNVMKEQKGQKYFKEQKYNNWLVSASCTLTRRAVAAHLAGDGSPVMWRYSEH